MLLCKSNRQKLENNAKNKPNNTHTYLICGEKTRHKSEEEELRSLEHPGVNEVSVHRTSQAMPYDNGVRCKLLRLCRMYTLYLVTNSKSLSTLGAPILGKVPFTNFKHGSMSQGISFIFVSLLLGFMSKINRPPLSFLLDFGWANSNFRLPYKDITRFACRRPWETFLPFRN